MSKETYDKMRETQIAKLAEQNEILTAEKQQKDLVIADYRKQLKLFSEQNKKMLAMLKHIAEHEEYGYMGLSKTGKIEELIAEMEGK